MQLKLIDRARVGFGFNTRGPGSGRTGFFMPDLISITDLQAEPGADTGGCCNLVDVPVEIPIKESRSDEKDIYV